jgi:hypothetical protein
MQSRVLNFRAPRKRRIKRPVNTRKGDNFVVLEVGDDSYLAFPIGSLAVIHCGKISNGLIHAIDSDEGVYLGRLVMREQMVEVVSLHRDVPSATYDQGDLIIVGALVELYTAANPTFRWVVWDESIEASNSVQLHIVK